MKNGTKKRPGRTGQSKNEPLVRRKKRSTHQTLFQYENGFVRMVRGEMLNYLLAKKPKAFLLLAQIASRARVSDDIAIDGLRQGQALLGDHKACGLTQSCYRTAKKALASLKIITIKTTNRGTIATLIDSEVFDIRTRESDKPNNKPNGALLTGTSQADDKLMATNDNGILEYLPSDDEKTVSEKKCESDSSGTFVQPESEPENEENRSECFRGDLHQPSAKPMTNAPDEGDKNRKNDRAKPIDQFRIQHRELCQKRDNAKDKKEAHKIQSQIDHLGKIITDMESKDRKRQSQATAIIHKQ